MKNSRGDLTDVSAKKEALPVTFKYLTAANYRPKSSTPNPCTDVDRATQISAQVTCTMHFIIQHISTKDDYRGSQAAMN